MVICRLPFVTVTLSYDLIFRNNRIWSISPILFEVGMIYPEFGVLIHLEIYNINVIANLLIMGNYLKNCAEKLLEPTIFFNLFTKTP